jgi:hypothetical protein
MKTITIFLVIFLGGCVSNQELLTRIDNLEKRVIELEHPKVVSHDIKDWGFMTELPGFMTELPDVKKVFCPKCLENSQSSIVRVGMSARTLMYVNKYYDENGKYHYDDPNITTTDYYCSQGHEWSVTE